MRALSPRLTAAAAVAITVLTAGAADAACKRMGFLVNDYGKEGPAKDAQDLLDKHVAEWAAQNGIKNYKIGKKDVSCELYLNLILFDEHTCTASANVCWDEPGKEKPAKTAKEKDASPSGKAAATEKASEKKSSNSTAGDAAPPAAEAEKTAATPADQPADTAPAAAIETGTVPSAPATSSTGSEDAAARAAAAAERAAEAAERAAAAAERAAAASKSAAPSQLEMPAFGAGKPADVPPVAPSEPKS